MHEVINEAGHGKF
jgi:hypothetical protein